MEEVNVNMIFYIQTSNPFIVKETNIHDSKISEAIESVFPMNTEELILFWNHVGIPISYKYDISYMIDDILMMLQNIKLKGKGELLIHWLPDTFRADWKLEWSGEKISINANWENLKGNLQKILVDSKRVELLKKEFISEWKMLLKILISALKTNGYDLLIKHQYDELVKNFKDIKDYGILYRNRKNSDRKENFIYDRIWNANFN